MWDMENTFDQVGYPLHKASSDSWDFLRLASLCVGIQPLCSPFSQGSTDAWHGVRDGTDVWRTSGWRRESQAEAGVVLLDTEAQELGFPNASNSCHRNSGRSFCFKDIWVLLLSNWRARACWGFPSIRRPLDDPGIQLAFPKNAPWFYHDHPVWVFLMGVQSSSVGQSGCPDRMTQV